MTDIDVTDEMKNQAKTLNEWCLCDTAPDKLLVPFETARQEIKKLESSISYYNSEQAQKLILELQGKVEHVEQILKSACDDCSCFWCLKQECLN